MYTVSEGTNVEVFNITYNAKVRFKISIFYPREMIHPYDSGFRHICQNSNLSEALSKSVSHGLKNAQHIFEKLEFIVVLYIDKCSRPVGSQGEPYIW